MNSITSARGRALGRAVRLFRAPSSPSTASLSKRGVSHAGLAAIAILISMPAWSYDWAIQGAHVVHMEGTYVPSLIPFNVDKAGGNCAAGTTLTYTGQGADTATAQANTKAIYALLLAARLSGTTVDLYGSNSGCTVTFVHLD